jgi:hypothetical protein
MSLGGVFGCPWADVTATPCRRAGYGSVQGRPCVCIGGHEAGTLRMLEVHGVHVFCCRACQGSKHGAGCSAGAVADHAGTVTTVVEVGSELEHARVAVLAATATAAECRARAGAVAGRRGDARVGVCWRGRGAGLLQGLCGRAVGGLCLQLQQARDIGTRACH